MSNLQVLDLAGNRLTGELPDSMSCLVRLEYLKLQSNNLSGLSAHIVIDIYNTNSNTNTNANSRTNTTVDETVKVIKRSQSF